MKVKELIEYLQEFDPDLDVWVSDAGYCEGATPCIEPEKILAIDAGLDGDEVDGEYFYYDPNDEDDVRDMGSTLPEPGENGYFPVVGKGYSKYIVLLRSQLDE